MKHIKTCLAYAEMQRRERRDSERTYHNFADRVHERAANYVAHAAQPDEVAAQPIAPAPRASRRRRVWTGLAASPATQRLSTEIAASARPVGPHRAYSRIRAVMAFRVVLERKQATREPSPQSPIVPISVCSSKGRSPIARPSTCSS
jgi:hypothetical protein